MSAYGFGIHVAPALQMDRNFNLQMAIVSILACDTRSSLEIMR